MPKMTTFEGADGEHQQPMVLVELAGVQPDGTALVMVGNQAVPLRAFKDANGAIGRPMVYARLGAYQPDGSILIEAATSPPIPYTDEQARDAAYAGLTQGAGVLIVVDDPANTATLAVNFASDAESIAGTSTVKAVNPHGLAQSISSALAAFVAGAPAALDTLAELAAALQNNPAVITEILTALGNRLRIDTAGQALSSGDKANAFANLGVSTFIQTLLDDANQATALGTLGAQPVDGDLTAIAALVTQAYGRALLTLTNQADLQAAVGVAGLISSAITASETADPWKRSVRAGSLTNVTIASMANGSSFGGVTLATGDRFAPMGQTTGSENGIYVANATGAPTRATDADTGAELLGLAVLVREGTLADKLYICTNDSIVVGTTALVFVPVGASSAAMRRQTICSSNGGNGQQRGQYSAINAETVLLTNTSYVSINYNVQTFAGSNSPSISGTLAAGAAGVSLNLPAATNLQIFSTSGGTSDNAACAQVDQTA